jgi:hypothetical protein
MEQEIWKDIPWYEWIYKINNLWKVKSLERYVNHSICKKIYIPERIRKVYLDKDWYERIALKLNSSNKYKIYWVHQLVMLSFIWPYPQKWMHINHIDYNKQNNLLDNLEYCTAKQNNEHKILKQWFKYPRWELHHWYMKRWKLSKLSKRVWQFKDWILIKEYDSLWECSRETGFNISNIWSTIYKDRQKLCHWYDFKYI